MVKRRCTQWTMRIKNAKDWQHGSLEKLLQGRHFHHLFTHSANIYKTALLPGPVLDVETTVMK